MALSDVVQNALPTWLGGSPVTANQAAVRSAAAAAEIKSVANSPGAQVQAQTVLDNDANLVNGQTYMFTFTSPTATAASLLADVVGQAPDFIGNPNTSQTGTALVLTFTYEGDGSDLVSDVANNIIAAGLIVNNDPLTFTGASANSGASVAQTIAPTVAAQVTASSTDQTTLANSANAAAAASDTGQLTSFVILGVIAVALFLFLAPKFLAATTPKVKVG